MKEDMKREVARLLRSWGLEETYVSAFIDNDMDLFAIEFMDKESLMALLPTHGLRIRFEQNRKQWINSMRENKEKSQHDEQLDNERKVEDRQQQHKGSPIWSNISGIRAEIPEMLMEGDEITLNSVLKSDENNVSKHGVLIATADGVHPLAVPVDGNISVTSGHETVASRQVLTQVNTPKGNKESYDLVQVLQDCVPDGPCILSKYNKDKKFVKDSMRDDLVECIVKNELKEDMAAMVSRLRMKLIAEQIVATFPTEEETAYFVTYRNPKTNKMCAKGKLVYKFYNTRRKYLSCGAIAPKYAQKSQLEGSNPLSSTDADDTTISGSLCWLEENSGGKGQWSELISHWERTAKYRMYKLINAANENALQTDNKDEEDASASKKRKSSCAPDPKKTAADYMKKYPAFEENSAFMLFEIDFKTLRPNIQSVALFTEWVTLSSFIVQQIRVTDAEFLQDPTLSKGEKTLRTLQSMSKLFPIVNVPCNETSALSKGKGKGKRSWRPSHAEVTDAFVTVHQTILTVEELKEKRREELQKQHLSLQPFVAVLGPVEQPLQFLVCIDDFFYEVDSLLKAVDVTFKSFFALHTPYPVEAQQIWLFIQKAVYGFSTTEDAHFSRVNTLCNDYSRFKLNARAPTSQ